MLIQTRGTGADQFPVTESASRRAPSRNWVFWTLVLLSVFNVWPLLWYRYLPFMDHPSHLLNANILANLNSPEFEYYRYFVINTLPAPNVLNDYLTALLAQVLPIEFALNLTVALAVCCLPLSVWFYLRQTRPGTEYWALLAVPLAWSQFLIYGSENFHLAVPMLFIFLGLLNPAEPSGRRILILLFVATAIYFAHFMVFAVAGLAATLHLACGRFTWRNAVLSATPLLPGSLLALIWIIRKPSGAAFTWDFSFTSRLQALVEGLCPFPYSEIASTLVWKLFCVSLLAFLFTRALQLFSKEPTMRYPALLTICSCVLAFFFQRWTVIFIADQRMWWMSLLIGLVLLPRFSKEKLITLGVFGLPLAIGAPLAMAPFFSQTNQQIAAVEKVFAGFPKKLRLLYFGDPRLPNYLHRAFEYYHLRHGGHGTMHLITPDQVVCYGPGACHPEGEEFGIYNFSVKPWLPYLEHFDGALIIADPSSPASQDIVSNLQKAGFSPTITGQITLMLRKP